ncbi:hypothetical protein BG006_007866 [Podila minutissima]|uniref:Uncharacterized protein n=1 Tax=Podila minutissima TaxID=64525 RepID=A0A9P5SRD4_9FUNG|nr:hypothetical protein BG006_007866 [Podila minutissima]
MLILRPLLSLILAMAVVFLILVALTRSMVAFRFEVQSRVLCNLPLVNHLVSCPSASSSPSGMHIPNFAELVNKQAKSYELIADSLSCLKSGKDTRISWSRKKGSETVIPGAGGGDEDPYGMTLYVKGMPLPLLLKRAELAVVDLKVLVKHSALAEPSKHLLVEQLESFHTRAKVAGRKLQFLQARANGCVDGLVIRNVYLTIELDRLEEEHRILKEQQESNWGRVWNLLSGSSDLQLVASEVKLHQLYQTTMSDARDHIRDLIVQAQDVLQSLDAMDQILSIINEITTKEKYHQNREHDKILAQLWSHLGGNRLEKRFHRNNLELLQDMEGQRKATVGQIQAALWKLTDFEAEIGILREKLVGATIDAALRRVGKEDATIKSHEGGSDNRVSSLGSDASSLRSHIQQIDLVTSRLKERSFLADALIKEQADLPSPASS